MAYESDYTPQEGFGSAFKNNFKETPKHPDFTGKAMFKGEIVDIAVWKKKTTKGDTYVSVSIKDEYKKEPSKSSPAGHSVNKGSQFEDMDDDVPF